MGRLCSPADAVAPLVRFGSRAGVLPHLASHSRGVTPEIPLFTSKQKAGAAAWRANRAVGPIPSVVTGSWHCLLQQPEL